MAEDLHPPFVRARPEKIAVEERYFYQAEIGDTTFIRFQRAEGEIRLKFPYDGAEFFDSTALDDVKRARSYGQPTVARAGFLSLTGHGRTSLAEVLEYDTIPISLPVNDIEAKIELDQRCVLRYRYHITEPDTWPMAVDARLIDESEYELARIERDTPPTSFDETLRLIITVEATSAQKADGDRVAMYVRLNWPYIVAQTAGPLKYDPEKKAIEWQHVELEKGNDGTYKGTISISIRQPKELFQQRRLEGQIRLSFEGRALSGLRPHYFDALGRRGRPGGPAIERSSTVIMDLSIALDAVFRRRGFYPHRRLHLDGVIPEPSRLADVHNILNDVGVHIDKQVPSLPEVAEDTFLDQARRGFFIVGVKHEQEDVLHLALMVKGDTSGVERRVQFGKRTDIRQLETGHLTVDIYGGARGDYRRLLRLLNEIEALMKERLEFVRIT